MIPIERNGPKGISDLIVRLLGRIGKSICDFSFFKRSAAKANPAPIQKPKITAEIPPAIPRKNPITAIYFTSPNPSQRPLEIKNNNKNGRGKSIPANK